LWEAQIEHWLAGYGVTFKRIAIYILDHPILLPCIVLAIYFGLAALRTLQDQYIWADITFEPVNDIQTSKRYCGIKIVSDKDVNVQNIKAEIIAADIANAKRFKLGENIIFPGSFPFTLGWFRDANITFENQLLGRGRELYLVLTQTNGHNYEHGVMVVGKNNSLIFQLFDAYLLTIRLSGEFENKPMRPKKLHVFIEYRDLKTQKFRVIEVKAA